MEKRIRKHLTGSQWLARNTYNRARYAANPEKTRERVLANRSANPEKTRAWDCERMKDPALREAKNARMREHMREKRKDPAFREVTNARAREKRRKRENRRQRKWTLAESAQVAEKIAECKRNESLFGVPYVIDHVFPIAGHGFVGLDLPINMAVIPASRNGEKRNKLPLAHLHLFHDDTAPSVRNSAGRFVPLPLIPPEERKAPRAATQAVIGLCQSRA